jgi:hypothetical protein
MARKTTRVAAKPRADKAEAKAKRGRGRPVNPSSLRQSGTHLLLRLPTDDLEESQAAAAEAGVALSDVVRRLLAGWRAGTIALPPEPG